MSDWSEYPNFITNDNDINLKNVCIIPKSEYAFIYDRAVFEKSVRWPIYYTIKIKFLNGDDWQHAWVKKVVTEQVAPLVYPNVFVQFVNNNEYADVKIQFVYNGTYGGSLIGTRCRNVGQNETSMYLGGDMLDFPIERTFEFEGIVYTVPDNIQGEQPDPKHNGSVIKHEFGHVFGKWHEHQNPINNPIQWDVQKTLQKYMTEPPPWTRDEVYENVINKLPLEAADATSFDPTSIMMYGVSPSLTLNGIGFHRMYDYSNLDIEWLQNHSFDPNKNAADFDKAIDINWNMILGIIGFIVFIVIIYYIIININKQ